MFIPKLNEPEKYVISDFINSEFVRLENTENWIISMAYPEMGMKQAETNCLVRHEIYELLLSAAKKLPNGIKLKILDAWRPLALQQELFYVYSKKIINDFGLEKLSEEKRNEFISKFVSLPSTDENYPPVHTTGGAIDVTLTDSNGNDLDMGTCFDDFSEKTHTAFFEVSNNNEIKENRRLLYTIMTDAGFTNLPSEWWHYDFGDHFWAYYKNRPSIYKGVFTAPPVKKI